MATCICELCSKCNGQDPRCAVCDGQGLIFDPNCPEHGRLVELPKQSGVQIPSSGLVGKLFGGALIALVGILVAFFVLGQGTARAQTDLPKPEISISSPKRIFPGQILFVAVKFPEESFGGYVSSPTPIGIAPDGCQKENHGYGVRCSAKIINLVVNVPNADELVLFARANFLEGDSLTEFRMDISQYPIDPSPPVPLSPYSLIDYDGIDVGLEQCVKDSDILIQAIDAVTRDQNGILHRNSRDLIWQLVTSGCWIAPIFTTSNLVGIEIDTYVDLIVHPDLQGEWVVTQDGFERDFATIPDEVFITFLPLIRVEEGVVGEGPTIPPDGM